MANESAGPGEPATNGTGVGKVSGTDKFGPAPSKGSKSGGTSTAGKGKK